MMISDEPSASHLIRNPVLLSPGPDTPQSQALNAQILEHVNYYLGNFKVPIDITRHRLLEKISSYNPLRREPAHYTAHFTNGMYHVRTLIIGDELNLFPGFRHLGASVPADATHGFPDLDLELVLPSGESRSYRCDGPFAAATTRDKLPYAFTAYLRRR
jgi:hypothetical protein